MRSGVGESAVVDVVLGRQRQPGWSVVVWDQKTFSTGIIVIDENCIAKLNVFVACACSHLQTV